MPKPINVRLDLEESDAFRAHVKEMLSNQVRSILREELHGIVAAEIAKLKLLQPGSQMLAELVERQLHSSIQAAANRVRTTTEAEIKAQVSMTVREAMRPIQSQLKAAIKEDMIRALKEMP